MCIFSKNIDWNRIKTLLVSFKIKFLKYPNIL